MSDQPQIQSGPRRPASQFKGVRYALEGALVGVAIVGLLDMFHGVRLDHTQLDFLGAVLGFAIVIVGRFVFLKHICKKLVQGKWHSRQHRD